MKYFELFRDSFVDYASYLGREILNPHWGNYFYWLIAISLAVYLLEILFPWRKDQARIRRDFWLDTWYMFFNFFIFSLVGYYALSNVLVTLINDGFDSMGIDKTEIVNLGTLPVWAQLLVMFLLRDFIHFNVHRLLHRVSWLWQFHKVHHSVLQMGYAAHLRFHWMETVVYRSLEYIPFALLGFGIQEFLIVHLFALTIGHLNHANLNWDYGPLKYLLNNPKMHIWHHMDHNPKSHPYGVNFGISLSLWDYLFGTVHIPHDGRDIELGFDDVDQFPQGFAGQLVWPLGKKSL